MDRPTMGRAARKSAVLLVVTLALAGCSTNSGTPSPPSSPASSTSAATTAPKSREPSLAYEGKEGVSALALLRAATNDHFKAKGSGKNAFVTSIDGVTADNSKHQYWAFYVNGKLAQVGAGAYVTKDGDEIKWKLETY